MRIVAWNIENLAPWLRESPSPLPELRERLGAPDVLCLQEVRIRPQDTELVPAMHAAWPGYVCHASLNHDARNGSFRGGRAYGVATWLREGLTPEPRHFEWDLEGRVIASLLPAQRLAIVNVYAVNGTAKPYWDAQRAAIHGDRHQFKQRFIACLGEEIGRLRADRWNVLAIGDWNVSRTRLDTTPRLRTEEPHATARRQFNEVFVEGNGLVDVFRHRCPDTRAYTWFNRRARGDRLDAARVDFALLDARLMERVIDTGIDAADDARPGSDHAPLWLELADQQPV